MIQTTNSTLPDQHVHQSCQTVHSSKHYLTRRAPSGIFSPRTINLTPVFRSLERITTPTKTEYDAEPEFQLINIHRDILPRKNDNLQLTSSSLIFSPAFQRHQSQSYYPSERLKTSAATSPRSSPFYTSASPRQKASSISTVRVPHSVLMEQDQRLFTSESNTRVVFQSPRPQQNVPQVVDFFTITGLSPKNKSKSNNIKIKRVNSRAATSISLSKRAYTPASSVTKKDAFTSCKDLKVEPESVRRVHTAMDDYKRGSGRYKLSDIFDLKPRRVKTKIQEAINGACYGIHSYRKE